MPRSKILQAVDVNRKHTWIESYTWIKCPNCGTEYDDEITYMCNTREGFFLNFCPWCGRRLRRGKQQ